MNAGRPASGLSYVLPATLLASVLGLGIQILVPIVRPPADYIDFSLFWSTLFFCVAALSGVQQELTRASRNEGDPAIARTTLRSYVRGVVSALLVLAIGIAIAVVALSSPVEPFAFVLWLALGVGAYAVLAAAVGIFFGTERWRQAALGMVADPLVRTVTLGGVALAVGIWALSPSTGTLYAAISIPFLIAAAVLWPLAVWPRVGGLSFDVPSATLARNTAHTVVAAAALGFVSIGLPVLVRFIGADLSAAQLGGALLVVTLARAPLVSPALALQSFLTVSFRTGAATARRRAVTFVVGLLGAGVVLGVVAALIGPPIMQWLWPDFAVPSALFIGLVVGSAALVAAQCVTGAALMAGSRHRAYTLGWVVTAVSAIGLAFLPLPFEARVSTALMLAPLAGLIVHGVSLTKHQPASPEDEPHQA